jgi:hypothetical protein
MLHKVENSLWYYKIMNTFSYLSIYPSIYQIEENIKCLFQMVLVIISSEWKYDLFLH